MLAYLARYGIGSPATEIVRQVTENVGAVEKVPKEQLTYDLLHNALAPALTVLDERPLLLCRHNANARVENAPASVESRFTLPEVVAARLRRLVGE